MGIQAEKKSTPSPEFFIELVPVHSVDKKVGPEVPPARKMVLPKPGKRVKDPTKEPKDDDDYQTVKTKLFSLADDLEGASAEGINDFDTLYDPIQKRKLAKYIRGLVESLTHLNVMLDFDCKLFKMKAHSPARDNANKIVILKKVFNAVVDPLGQYADFADFVDEQKAHYSKTKNPTRLLVIGHLQAMVSGMLMFASWIAGLVTNGIGFIGLVPTVPIFVNALRKIDDARLAQEREKLEKMNAIIGSFKNNNEYDNIKRQLFYTVGTLKGAPDGTEPLTDEKKAYSPRESNILQHYIVNLIKNLDKSNLPEQEKIEILTQVNEIAADPKNLDKARDFAQFVKNTHKKFPTDSEKMCDLKMKAGVILAFLGFIASTILIGFTFGASLAGYVVFPALAWKYGQYKSTEQKLSMAKDTLSTMSSIVNSNLPTLSN